MSNPVLSSFGSRPLMEVPAMQVSRQGPEVPSLQAPYTDPVVPNPFPTANNPMIPPGVYNPQPGYFTAGGLPPPVQYGGMDRRFATAPQPSYPGGAGRQYFYGPNGEMVNGPHYNSQMNYPGVHNPYVTRIPPAPPLPYSLYGFKVTCELEYGQVVNIDVRESQGSFRGIPPNIQRELMNTYGKYPYTKVKIQMENGEFHIYASHAGGRRGMEDDYDERPRDRFYDDEDWEYDSRFDDRSSGVSDGVRPRNPMHHTRMTHENGWNRYR